MKNTFISALENPITQTTTEWGETVFKDLGNPFVEWLNQLSKVRDDKKNASYDFYSRNNPDPLKKLESTFEKMYSMNSEMARKILFATYDVRGGNGLRSHFRIGLKYIINNDLRNFVANIDNIPHFGRWDMLIDAYNYLQEIDSKDAIEAQSTILRYCAYTLVEELNNLKENKPQNTLIAKWMPSATSKNKKHKLFKKNLIATLYGTYNASNEKKYRQMIVMLRKELKLVESFMSHGEWDKIDFSTTPGIALKKYKEAWKRHIPSEWENYLEQVDQGKKKINAKVVDIVDIVGLLVKDGFTFYASSSSKEDKQLADTMWENRNKVHGQTFLPVIDMSGSMYSDSNGGSPILTAIAVGLHVSEFNAGAFKDVAVTFATSPSFISFKDSHTLSEKINKLFQTRVGYTTNLHKVFQLYLNTAKRSDVKQKDLPEGILVISDMEVSVGSERDTTDVLSKVQKMFDEANIPMPHLVWWNASNNNGINVANALSQKCTVLSGSSPAFLKYISYGQSPIDLVDEIVNNERYSRVV